jgi:hypothetical protein
MQVKIVVDVKMALRGKVAEWLNAPDSKFGIQGNLYRGFKSLPFRHAIDLARSYSAALG